MTQVVSSISGLQVYAPSAGFAPTNSADVSAIASGYQVVSSTATQLYAGTAYLTSVNDAPVSASRAGNATNAGMANSAYYDGTGRLISSLPDSAAVSAIASSYAESAASGKQDTLTFAYDDDKISAINGSALAGQGGVTGDYVEKSALEVSIGSANYIMSATSYAQQQASGNVLIQGKGNSAFGASLAQGRFNSATYSSFSQGNANNATGFSLAQGSGNKAYAGSFAQGYGNSASGYSVAQGHHNSAYNYSVAIGYYNSATDFATAFGINNLLGNGSTATGDSVALVIGDGHSNYSRHDLMVVTKDGEITMYSSTADTTGTGIMSSIRAISAAATGGGVDSATVSAIASSYAESAASSKQDTLTFAYDADSAISAINGSALAGGGTVTGAYVENSALDSATARSATGSVLPTAIGISSISGKPLIPTLLAQPTLQYGGQSTFAYMPESSMWTTADDATGVFSPLQYATGACLAMDAGYFKAYYKGNEWFVTDSRYGYARGEVHNSRGCRVIVEHTGGAGAVLSARSTTANVTLNSTALGTAKMEVGYSQAYVQVQRGTFNNTTRFNSAKLDTDYLKFYNGMATGYLDPEDTASGTSYMPAETEYIYISSIPYWNAKLDASAIECDTASAITAIGGSAIGGGGGVDSATVSAIASSYADSAASGKVDQSAYDDLYSAFTALNDLVSQYSAYFSSISAKVDNSAIGVIE